MFEPKGLLEERIDKLEKETEKVQDYIRRLRESMQEESADRLEELINIYADSVTTASLTSTDITATDITSTGLDIGTGAIETTSKVRAYLSTDQLNISSGVATKVLLDTEDYDPGDNFANYKFTAPVTGYYQVNAGIRYVAASVVADKRYDCTVRRNNVIVIRNIAHSAVVETILPTCSGVVYLIAGQYLELFVYHAAGVDTVDVDGGTNKTYISVHLLSI